MANSASRPRRLGLFGGTFDPIHVGHLLVAQAVERMIGLDEVLFVPTGAPPHKPPEAVAPPRHRVAMTRLAIAGLPTFRVTEIEAARRGPSYSIETVKTLKAQVSGPAELFFIMGLDAFLEIPAWREVNSLLTLCHFAIAARPGYRFVDVAKVLPEGAVDSRILHDIANLDRGSRERLDLPLTPSSTLFLLRIAPCPVSSTMVRAGLRAGRPAESDVLPPDVSSYIMTYGLYAGAGPR